MCTVSKLIELQYHCERSLGKTVGTTHEVEVETVALNGLHCSVGMLRYTFVNITCQVILLYRPSDSCYIQ